MNRKSRNILIRNISVTNKVLVLPNFLDNDNGHNDLKGTKVELATISYVQSRRRGKSIVFSFENENRQ